MKLMKNKNIFYRTLLASTAIALCFSMDVQAGKKQQEELMRRKAEEEARKSTAALRAFQQKAATAFVGATRAAEIKKEVFQAPPVVTARVATLVKEVSTLPPTALTAEHAKERAELAVVAPTSAPAITSAIQDRLEQDYMTTTHAAEKSGASFSDTQEQVARVFENNPFANESDLEAVSHRPTIIAQRVHLCEEEAARTDEVSADFLEEMVSLRAVASVAQCQSVANKLADNMEKNGIALEDMFPEKAKAFVPPAVLQVFQEEFEVHLKDDVAALQRKLLNHIQGNAYSDAFGLYLDLLDPERAALRTIWVQKLYRDAVPNVRLMFETFRDEVIAARLGIDADHVIRDTAAALVDEFTAYVAEVRARVNQLIVDIDAVADPADLTEPLYRRIFHSFENYPGNPDNVLTRITQILNYKFALLKFAPDLLFDDLALRYGGADHPEVEALLTRLHGEYAAYQQSIFDKGQAVFNAFGTPEALAVDTLHQFSGIWNLSSDENFKALRDQLFGVFLARSIPPAAHIASFEALIAATAEGDRPAVQIFVDQLTLEYQGYIHATSAGILANLKAPGFNGFQRAFEGLIMGEGVFEGGLHADCVAAFEEAFKYNSSKKGISTLNIRHVLTAWADPFAHKPFAAHFRDQQIAAYEAFFPESARRVAVLEARVGGGDFGRPELDELTYLAKRVPDARMTAVKQALFERSYREFVVKAHFADSYAAVNYDGAADVTFGPAVGQCSQALTEGFAAYVKEALTRDYAALKVGALDDAKFSTMMRSAVYGSADEFENVQELMCSKLYLAATAAGANPFNGHVAQFDATAHAAYAARFAAQLNAVYDGLVPAMDAEIAFVRAAILADPSTARIFEAMKTIKPWMAEADYTVLTTAYLTRLEELGVALDFTRMTQDYLAANVDEDPAEIEALRVTLIQKQGLIATAAGRVADLRDHIAHNNFADNDFSELLNLQTVIPAGDVATVVGELSNMLYARGILDGASYFAKFASTFNTVEGQALTAHLTAEHDRLVGGTPMKVLYDAVEADDFDLTLGTYDVRMAQIVNFMLDAGTTAPQRAAVKDQLFGKIFKSEAITTDAHGDLEMNLLDPLFGQFNLAPNQVQAEAVRDELKADYPGFYTQKSQEIDTFLEELFDVAYDPLTSLTQYAEFVDLMGPDYLQYVQDRNWFRLTYTNGVDAGATYFQGLVGGLDPTQHAKLNPVAVALDGQYDAYFGAHRVAIAALNTLVGQAHRGRGPRFSNDQFNQMFEMSSALRAADSALIEGTLFARLRGARVHKNAFYTNRVIEAQYAPPRFSADYLDRAKTYRDELLNRY